MRHCMLMTKTSIVVLFPMRNLGRLEGECLGLAIFTLFFTRSQQHLQAVEVLVLSPARHWVQSHFVPCHLHILRVYEPPLTGHRGPCTLSHRTWGYPVIAACSRLAF